MIENTLYKIENIFYNLSIRFCAEVYRMTDYKKMITEMLDKIHSEAVLKRIYNFICRVYLRGGK